MPAHMKVGLAASMLAVACTAPAAAQTFDVKQLEITRGALELGLDNTAHRGVPHERGADINRSAHDQSLDYGVSSWWRLSGVFKLENPEEEQFRFARAAIENIFVLKPLRGSHDVGLGWFQSLEASTHRDTTNATLFGPIVTLKADRLSLTANPFFEKTFGRNQVEGIAFNYGWHAKYELRQGLAIGIEGFGLIDNIGNPPPFEEQEHRIGPALFAEIELAKGVTIAPDLGLLFGLTRATPDVALKLNIGIPLHEGEANGANGAHGGHERRR